MRDLNGGVAFKSHPESFSSSSLRVVVAVGGEQERWELRSALEFEGYRVAVAGTVNQAFRETGSGLNRALLLGAGFGGVEPYELCRRVRANSDIGIIVVDSHGSRQGRIDLLNAGADDYVAAPFVMRELVARVRAVIRRVTCYKEQHEIILQDRMIDLNAYEIKGPGSHVTHLTPKEHLVLQCLVAHANQELTHRFITRTVWQRDGGSEVEYLRVVIGQLRRKLESDPDHPRYIVTERSVGYRFNMPTARLAADNANASELSLTG